MARPEMPLARWVTPMTPSTVGWLDISRSARSEKSPLSNVITAQRSLLEIVYDNANYVLCVMYMYIRYFKPQSGQEHVIVKKSFETMVKVTITEA